MSATPEQPAQPEQERFIQEESDLLQSALEKIQEIYFKSGEDRENPGFKGAVEEAKSKLPEKLKGLFDRMVEVAITKDPTT